MITQSGLIITLIPAFTAAGFLLIMWYVNQVTQNEFELIIIICELVVIPFFFWWQWTWGKEIANRHMFDKD